MIRDRIDNRLETDPDFRWRGAGVSRVENLSDIVFALSLGMVVTAASAPTTFGDLMDVLVGIVPVGLAFLTLLMLWNAHFLYFRRYGLTSTAVMAVNGLLLFVVLYLAYPMRFAFDALFAFVFVMFGDTSRAVALELNFPRSGVIIAYFAAGFGAAHALYAWLYQLAWRARGALGLDPLELALTRAAIQYHLVFAVASALTVPLALLTPLYGLAGFVLNIPSFARIWSHRNVRRLKANLAKAERATDAEG